MIMQCFYPKEIWVKTKPYATKQTVPCGQCINCLQNKRAEWTFRLEKELKNARSAWFITLTYCEEDAPLVDVGTYSLYKRDLGLFIKNIRKQSDYIITKHLQKNPIASEKLKHLKIKYYAVGEYGDKTNRPHYHMIIFNLPRAIIEKIDKIWKKGFVKVGTCNTASIHYVCKYVINRHNTPEGCEKPFSFISNGIGIDYTITNKKTHNTLNPYLTKDGYKQSMPRYYKNKLYTEDELKTIGETNKQNYLSKRKEFVNHIKSTGQDIDQYEKTQKKQAIQRFNNLTKKNSKF